jgi:hypothetical protein
VGGFRHFAARIEAELAVITMSAVALWFLVILLATNCETHLASDCTSTR